MDYSLWGNQRLVWTSNVDEEEPFVDSQESFLSTQKHHDRLMCFSETLEPASPPDVVIQIAEYPVEDPDELFVACTPPWEDPLPEEPIDDLRQRLNDRTPERELENLHRKIYELEERARTLSNRLDAEVVQPSMALRREAERVFELFRARSDPRPPFQRRLVFDR